jgi:putative transposase
MARGVDRRDIFTDDLDREYFLKGMRRLAALASANIIAYCLMGNHFHLAIQVEAVTLSAFMQRLLTTYCMMFNRKHERTGHLFEARYKANLCEDDLYLARLIPYIHMNPVRAGFVADPKDWPWSSYDPAKEKRADMEGFDPWPASSREIDLSRSTITGQIPLDEIGLSVASSAAIGLADLLSGSHLPAVVAAKRLFAQEAMRNGYDLSAIAEWIKLSPRSISRYARESFVRPAGLTPRWTKV